jgi:hypothetical protein
LILPRFKSYLFFRLGISRYDYVINFKTLKNHPKEFYYVHAKTFSVLLVLGVFFICLINMTKND